LPKSEMSRLSKQNQMGNIIQFFHPGIEHNTESGIKWHTGGHKRKFMRTKGSYVNELGQLNSGDVHFWGEWEAQSTLLENYGDSVDNKPRLLFEPFYSLESQRDCNTDPFVFGNQFYYCICKQGHYPSMRSLETLDIILFGSHKDGDFVLDTLFVVKSGSPYSSTNIDEIRDNVNQVFFDVTVSKVLQAQKIDLLEVIEHHNGCFEFKEKEICDSDKRNYCLTNIEESLINYSAVMYNEKDDFDGVFSFSPCSINGRFARPKLKIDGILNSSKTQGLKISQIKNPKDIWELISKQIFEQGLFLMIENVLPNKNR